MKNLLFALLFLFLLGCTSGNVIFESAVAQETINGVNIIYSLYNNNYAEADCTMIVALKDELNSTLILSFDIGSISPKARLNSNLTFDLPNGSSIFEMKPECTFR